MFRNLPPRLTSRRGAWVALAVGLGLMIALIGLFGRAELSGANEIAPPDSESARAAQLADTFPGSDEQVVLLVATRDDGGAITESDSAALAELANPVQDASGHTTVGPFTSEDGQAAVIQATIDVGDGTDAARTAVTSVRDAVSAHAVPGLTVQVTGGPAFGVDVAASFDGADLTLLLVTIAIVALLLIITYRSPVLWMIPLAVVALADQLANKATVAVGAALDLQFDTGIVSVLVFGAGTNYALLLVSRYREQLALQSDHRRALTDAWKATVAAIVASNLTVVLSLATLVLAVIPGTRGLGISSALGLLIALASVLLVLPPALGVCGRGVFWPFVPRPGSTREYGRAWRVVAEGVVRRPWVPLVGGVTLLGVMAAGLLGTSIGLTQVEKFRVPSESAAGLEVLSAHFDPGQAQPMTIVLPADRAETTADAVADIDGVVRVREAATTDDGSLAKLSVTGKAAPGTQASLDLVQTVRDVAHEAAPDALVGGAVASDLDARTGNLRDLLIIAPLVLGVSLIVLIVLLRALVAPILLLLINASSAVAAVGAGAWLSRTLFGWDALDLQVPLLAFLFLVALGIDYTIFLVHRSDAEARRHGTRAGIVRAVSSTGGVITSAGVVLAGVFAALGVLPLVTLGQIGLIVGVGVLVDTFVVRTLVVPAVFALLGDRSWLPRRLPEGPADRADRGESEDASLPVATR